MDFHEKGFVFELSFPWGLHWKQESAMLCLLMSRLGSQCPYGVLGILGFEL